MSESHYILQLIHDIEDDNEKALGLIDDELETEAYEAIYAGDVKKMHYVIERLESLR